MAFRPERFQEQNSFYEGENDPEIKHIFELSPIIPF
jgi:hypothetical protein